MNRKELLDKFDLKVVGTGSKHVVFEMKMYSGERRFFKVAHKDGGLDDPIVEAIGADDGHDLKYLLELEHTTYFNDLGRSKPPAPPEPPRFAERMLMLMAPKRSVDAQLGDMQEMFERDCKRFGIRRAREKYIVNVARSVGPLVWSRMKKLGVIALFVDLWHRIAS